MKESIQQLLKEIEKQEQKINMITTDRQAKINAIWGLAEQKWKLIWKHHGIIYLPDLKVKIENREYQLGREVYHGNYFSVTCWENGVKKGRWTLEKNGFGIWQPAEYLDDSYPYCKNINPIDFESHCQFWQFVVGKIFDTMLEICLEHEKLANDETLKVLKSANQAGVTI